MLKSGDGTICMRRLLISIVIWLMLSGIGTAQNNEIENSDFTPVQAIQVFGGALDAVAFSPDGKQLATGGRDKAVRFWDVETGENTVILSGHDDWVSSVAYSPDGSVVASGGRDGNIWLWNVDTGTSLRLIEDHQTEVKALTFTPDGKYLVSGSLDGIIRIEPVGYPDATQMMTNFGGGVWSMAISPDGTTLAIGSEDGTIWLLGLWDSNQVWVTKLVQHDIPVMSLQWSSDGIQLISGEQNGHILLWNVENAQQGETAVSFSLLSGHLAPVMGVGFTTHEGVAISTGLDGTVRLWDIAGELDFASELSTIKGTGAPLTNLAMSANGILSASVGTDGTLSIWSTDQETLSAVIASQRPVVLVDNPAQNPSLSSTNIRPTPSEQSGTSTQTPITVSGPILSIPSVNMSVGITTFPLDGVSWAIDPWEKRVGHLQGTSWLSGTGNMALGGHSVYPDGRAGVFNSLYNVSLGDEIIVQDGDTARTYIVSEIRTVDYTDISVVYPTAHNRVTLITCDIPSFQAETGLYGDRLVVIADAVS